VLAVPIGVVRTGSKARGHGVPCARYKAVDTGYPETSRGPVRTGSGVRGLGGGGNFAITTPNSKGEKKNWPMGTQ
jgi:hypothetical protein